MCMLTSACVTVWIYLLNNLFFFMCMLICPLCLVSDTKIEIHFTIKWGNKGQFVCIQKNNKNKWAAIFGIRCMVEDMFQVCLTIIIHGPTNCKLDLNTNHLLVKRFLWTMTLNIFLLFFTAPRYRHWCTSTQNLGFVRWEN